MIYLEDDWLEHEKFVAVGGEGVLVWLAGMQWLKLRRSTDGRIPKVVALAKFEPRIKGKPLPVAPIMARLIEVESWHDDGDHVIVHGYTERNEAAIQRSQVGKANAEKRWEKERARRAKPMQTAMPLHANGNATALQPQCDGSGSGNAYSPQSTVHSPQPDVVTPSLATRSEAAEAEGGSGGPWPEVGEDDAMVEVDALLRKVCPPDKMRLYGAPRGDLQRALDGGASLSLVLAAIRQGDPNEGAFLRVGRAMTAIREGKLPSGGGGVPPRPYVVPPDLPPADAHEVAAEIAQARAAVGR